MIIKLLLVLFAVSFCIGCAPRSGYLIEFEGKSPTTEGYERGIKGKVNSESYSSKVLISGFKRDFILILDEFFKLGNNKIIK